MMVSENTYIQIDRYFKRQLVDIAVLDLSVATRGSDGTNKGIEDTGGILTRGSLKCQTKSQLERREGGQRNHALGAPM